MGKYKSFEDFVNYVQGRAISQSNIGTISLKKKDNMKGTGNIYDRIYTFDEEKYTEECFSENGSDIEEECLKIGIENLTTSIEDFFDVKILEKKKDEISFEVNPSDDLKRFIKKSSEECPKRREY